MFLKKDTLTLGSETVTLFELSALQRAEYFAYLADKEADMVEGTSDLQKTAQMVKLNIEVNAWMVSRSLWHSSPERDENEIHQEVMRTWPTEALNLAVDKVMTLSDMNPKKPDQQAKSDDSLTPTNTDERPLAK